MDLIIRTTLIPAPPKGMTIGPKALSVVIWICAAPLALLIWAIFRVYDLIKKPLKPTQPCLRNGPWGW